MSYWDSSSLAKLYLKEPDSDLYLALAKTALPVRTSPLGQFEVTLAIRRHEIEGKLDPPSAEALVDELLFDIGEGTVELLKLSSF